MNICSVLSLLKSHTKPSSSLLEHQSVFGRIHLFSEIDFGRKNIELDVYVSGKMKATS